MPIQFGQPPINLGAILGGLGAGRGGGLMELLNLLFRGGAGRRPLMPGITGGQTMAGVPTGGPVPGRPPTVKPAPVTRPPGDFTGGIAFAPGTEAKERATASSSLDRILGGG